MNPFKKAKLRSIEIKELEEMDRVKRAVAARLRLESHPDRNIVAGDYHDLNDFELQQNLY